MKHHGDKTLTLTVVVATGALLLAAGELPAAMRPEAVRNWLKAIAAWNCAAKSPSSRRLAEASSSGPSFGTRPMMWRSDFRWPSTCLVVGL